MSSQQPTVVSSAATPAEALRCVDIGHYLSLRGRFNEAELSFRRAITLHTDLPLAHSNLGWVREMQGDSDGAIASYRHALQLDPGLQVARRNLALLLVQLDRVEESVELWHAEMLTETGHLWADEMISRQMGLHDLTLAGRYAELIARIRWGSRWYPPRVAVDQPPLAPLTPELWLSIPKLKHDIDQFLYLQRRGIFGAELTPVIAEYERVIERLTPQGDARVPFDNEAQQTIGDVYNRIIYMRHSPRLKRALSNKWDAASLEAQYLENPPGVVIVDDFLSDEALEELRLFCLESTFWSANRYSHGRLGAFFRDGFSSPLLLQIAEELRESLPRVIGDRYPLRQLWGFKNTQTVPPGSGTHADFAAVNVNFWITPSEANLDPACGGLVVYEVDAPLNWDFYAYNADMDLIHSYLRQHQARKIVIPYRQNRAIIFNSDLFHSTDGVRFRPDYETQRVNITMLYGEREHDVHHLHIAPPDVTNHQAAWRSAAFSRMRR